jgi:predicted AlkP superfamily pyrophosphatase or phosphodiesterase
MAEVRSIVLLVVDGLGQQTLDRHSGCRNLRSHRIATLSSVFPSTTATAIPSFMTGRAPAQHGLTGWHMHLDEIDQTLAILPLTPRCPPAKRVPQELPPLLFDYPTLFQQLERECWVLAPQSIAGSPFNAWHSRGAETRAYATLAEMFAQLAGLLKNARSPRYIYAYYPDLDMVSHRFGTGSERAQQTLALFDTAFGEFIHEVQGSDVWLMVIADHGFIDSPPERVVSLDDHPQLAALLARPLCGERRVAYCYVAPANRPAFEAYVRQHLAHCADLCLSADLIRDGWYGPPPFHARLASRIGDYTLVMKDNWTIKDWLPGEKRYGMLGVHGGVSPDEMRVPLIALRV